MGAPSCGGSPEPSPTVATTEFLRSRIATLLRDPAVARRVGRRLGRAAAVQRVDMAGTPPCLRAAGTSRSAPVLVKSGRCRTICRSVDCLCGRYPHNLTDREIEDGRRLDALLV
jgi:hypothetical protein